MSPSDIILQIGTIVGYNNKIVIATENQALGFNNDVNVQSSIPPTAVSGTETKKSLPEIDNNQKHANKLNPVSITEDQKKNTK